jgi:hypothetical protein
MDAHIEAIKQSQAARELQFKREEDSFREKLKQVRNDAVSSEKRMKSDSEKELAMMGNSFSSH